MMFQNTFISFIYFFRQAENSSTNGFLPENSPLETKKKILHGRTLSGKFPRKVLPQEKSPLKNASRKVPTENSPREVILIPLY